MPRIVAVDLGAHAAKVSVYQSTGRKVTLEGRFSQPVPQDGAAAPGLDARLAALDALLAAHRAWASPANEVVLAWSSAHASTRVIDLPFTDRAQVERTLPFTVEGEVPFDLDEMVLAWKPLAAEAGTRAFVGLAPRDRLQEWITGLAKRGLDPKGVHLDGEGLARFAPPTGTVAVVDVGHSHSVVAVVSDGRTVAVRSVDVAGMRFTQAIQRTLGIPWSEAEALKHGPSEDRDGSIDRLPLPARQAVDAQIGLLLAEIRSTLIAAEDDQGVEVQAIVLTGAGARLDPIGAYLAQDLGLPVTRPVEPDNTGVPPAFGTSAGLGLAVARGGKERPLDLRAGSLAWKGGVNVLRAVVVYGTAALAFFLFTTVVMFVVQYRSLSKEQAELEGRIKGLVTETFPDVPAATIRDSTTAMAILSERTLEASSRAEVFHHDGVPPTIDHLYALTKAFPPPTEVVVAVSDLTITRATIKFTAETDGYATASRVEEALRAEPRFAEAAKSGDKKVREKVQFNVTIPLAAAPAEEG